MGIFSYKMAEPNNPVGAYGLERFIEETKLAGELKINVRVHLTEEQIYTDRKGTWFVQEYLINGHPANGNSTVLANVYVAMPFQSRGIGEHVVQDLAKDLSGELIFLDGTLNGFDEAKKTVETKAAALVQQLQNSGIDSTLEGGEIVFL